MSTCAAAFFAHSKDKGRGRGKAGKRTEGEGFTCLNPKHALEPRLKGTRYFSRRWAEGWSQRSGEKDLGLGNMVGLSCNIFADMLTGVWEGLLVLSEIPKGFYPKRCYLGLPLVGWSIP